MRKIIFPLILGVLPFVVMAQSPLSNAERYIIGSEFEYANVLLLDTLQEIEETGSWDFLGSRAVTDTTVLSIKAPQNMFQNADYVESSTDGSRIYCVLNDSACTAIGYQSTPNELLMDFIGPQTYMFNKLYLNDTFKADYEVSYQSYGQPSLGSGTTMVTLLRKGVMTLPSRTVDCYLVKIVQDQRDSNQNSGQISFQKTTTYTWFEEGNAEPMVRYTISESKYGTYYFLNYLIKSTLGTRDLINSSMVFLHPVPVRDVLFVESDHLLFTDYSVADLSGRVIASGKITANQIRTTDFSSGVYHLKLETPEGVVVVKKFIRY